MALVTEGIERKEDKNIVYYDENAKFGSNSGIYVKIHKQDCPHHTKESKSHSGKRIPDLTFDEAYKCASEKATKGQLLPRSFCKHCLKEFFE